MGDFPDDCQIHLEVGVDKPIPHADYLAPRDLGMSLAKVIRKVARRFADNVQLAHHCVLHKLTFQELLPSDSRKVTLHT